MPYYQERLKQSILKEVDSTSPNPLEKLNIVVNAGNGSGFYLNDVLRDLGANVDGSVHLTPDGSFPESFGVPNPENHPRSRSRNAGASVARQLQSPREWWQEELEEVELLVQT